MPCDMQAHDVFKRRLDSTGKVIENTVERHTVGPEQDTKLLHATNETECGSCYGAEEEHECCNTCDEVSLVTVLCCCISARLSTELYLFAMQCMLPSGL